MTTPLAIPPHAHHQHPLFWLLSVVIAFLLGVWVMYRHAPPCLASTASAAAAGGAASAPSRSPAVDSQTSAGTTSAAADASGGGGGGGPAGAPAGAGSADNASSPTGSAVSRDPGAGGVPANDPSDPDLAALARGYAMSSGGLGPAGPDSTSAQPGATTVMAHDFTYDVTGLPRYPNAVSKVASARATKSQAPADTGSTCVLLTTDSFGQVVAWYHGQLPTTWKQAVIPNFDALGKGLSVSNIAKMLAALRPGSTPSMSTVLDTTGNSRDHISVAVWEPPSSEGGGSKGVMVVTKTGKPTEIILKRRVGT
jgi:hypothetical protein